MTVAVLGCYRSGSSLLAGVLDQLGVDMGRPFFGEYFEPEDLSRQLRQWWDEPRLVESVPRQQRVAYLRQWRAARCQNSEQMIGAKHPLLALSAHDVEDAWGRSIVWLWAKRPLNQSIESLERLQWWPNPEAIQTRLWNEIESFLADRQHLVVEFAEMLSDPRRKIESVVEFAGLQRNAESIEPAIKLVRPTLRSPGADSAHRDANSIPVAEPGDVSDGGPQIVATMLSGNCQELVEEAIATVNGLICRLILIDTGITDDTLKHVREAFDGDVQVERYGWCDDFADARNFALRCAVGSGARWALTLDTDERMDLTAYSTKQALLAALDREPVDAWMVPARDHSYAKERFIRLPPRMRWMGKTHETMSCPPDVSRKPLPAAQFWERRKDPEQFRIKLQRDYQILASSLEDNPNNSRWRFYLAQTLEGLGRLDEAADAYQACFVVTNWAEEAAWSSYKAGDCLSQRKRFAAAVSSCASGMARVAGFPELAWLAAWCRYQQGHYQDAVHWSVLAVSLGCVTGCHAAKDRIGFRNTVAWYEGPFDIQRFAYRRLGRLDEAELAEGQFQLAKEQRLSLH